MYDLVVIGGGSAGLTAVSVARKMGVKVALIEKERTGGDCTWTGCIPSKSLIKAASVAHQMRTADKFGIDAVEPKIDLGRVMARVRQVIDDIYADETPDVLRNEGADVFLGGARFVGPHTVQAGDDEIEAKKFLICTGAHAVAPPIEGLEHVPYLNHENVWEETVLPEHLIVVGGGPIGCEMAQAFRRLGSRVTIVQSGPRILPNDEPEASEALTRVFEAEAIELCLGARATKVDVDEHGIKIVAGSHEVVGDRLLIAAGRRPNVKGLDLEKAGVVYTEKGIDVDDALRTNQKHIFACGDVIGGPQFTHYAGWQGAIAVRNSMYPGTSKGVLTRVPWATFTDPEVAHAGETEAEARDRLGDDVQVFEWKMGHVDRARTDGKEAGFLKVVHASDGQVLGATLVASRAGETIHEWIIAIDNGLHVGDLVNSIHVYPTYSTGNQQAGARIRLDQLFSGTSGKILRGVGKLLR